jgi:hypothetical protein
LTSISNGNIVIICATADGIQRFNLPTKMDVNRLLSQLEPGNFYRNVPHAATTARAIALVSTSPMTTTTSTKASPAPLGERNPNTVQTAKSSTGSAGKKRKSATAADDGDNPSASKRSKTSSGGTANKSNPIPDVSGITLQGEQRGSVPVYDTPREVRRKLNQLVRKGASQAAMARALSDAVDSSDHAVSVRVLRTFLEQKGVLDGNTSTAYYGGYVLFEKQRVKDDAPKTAFRQEMERVHGAKGVDRSFNLKSRGLICFGNERPTVDKYAKVQIVRVR